MRGERRSPRTGTGMPAKLSRAADSVKTRMHRRHFSRSGLCPTTKIPRHRKTRRANGLPRTPSWSIRAVRI